jgi:hypothetical protein
MLTLTLRPADLDPFRLMLREQMAGDAEPDRDLRAMPERPDAWRLRGVEARLRLLDRLAEGVGGLC